jgi:hypothetical protein
LGSSGFIFLDDRPWPYLVRQESSGDLWLYYWRDSTKQFATMRKITFEEMLAFRERRLPDEKAALYLPNVERRRPDGKGGSKQ